MNKSHLIVGAVGFGLGFLLSMFTLVIWPRMVIPSMPDNVIMRQTLQSHCQKTPIRLITCDDRADTCVCGDLTGRPENGDR